MSDNNTITLGGKSRRDFITNCAAIASVPLLAGLPINAFAAGANDRLKVGLIGAGGRGNGAVTDILNADKNVELWAIGDVFADQAKSSQRRFAKNQRAKVPDERVFSGFDNYKEVLNSGIDIAILTTPPGFRPLHLEAAIEKGVHVFAEKPVAVDPVGARRVIAAGELAAKKGLSIVAGTQRRHDFAYIETLKRVRDGAIGEIVGGQVYWVQGGLWHKGRNPKWTDIEYQIRNWLYFTWVSGDHIVEQHVHNIDVANWAFGGPPVKAFGMGGRQSRTDKKYGDAWDHFAIEYEYANGARVQSFCRQVVGASHRVGERIVGTKGVATSGRIVGEGKNWHYSGRSSNAYVQEHVNLVKAIRTGKPINEARNVAESTLTGILGRISAYTGKEVSYKWALEASKLDLAPAKYELGPGPKVEVPIPGSKNLV
ncbi:MAG: Gfo/Idh/MocA family oxidoreductase [Puniceicoccales bacterium]|jgi:predicted dehydrogenase|nr:Gfo/Idh/MocA family oxidoreductase [Puniceicoccales bacterium]